MTIKSNLSMFSNVTSPKLVKDYCNIPTKVFRNGQYVNIQEHNSKQRINAGRK